MNTKAKILLVEDEKTFGAVLRDYLSIHDLDVTWCADGNAGAKEFSNASFDLCIVDVMMPGKDGFTLVQEIREQNKVVPVVFLTARAMKEDVLKGYRAGADDYITKPFDTEVLLHKIRAILERSSINGSQPKEKESAYYELGALKFDPSLRTISRGGETLFRLSPREAQLLQLLCRNMNALVPREKALKEIWKEDNYFTGRSMDVYIVKLRKYLSSETTVALKSVPSSGYVLSVER